MAFGACLLHVVLDHPQVAVEGGVIGKICIALVGFGR
jgi:hypothetical protein